ncbi:hypothetical protein [Enterobacter mori]|uniref:hypothetical protein n=1 Tax=Enterobacter mori TaxID=539813 RepID=UPI00397C97E6
MLYRIFLFYPWFYSFDSYIRLSWKALINILTKQQLPPSRGFFIRDSLVAEGIKFVVVGHISRIGHAQRLAAMLDAHLLIDDGKHGANWNHRRAFEWVANQRLLNCPEVARH